MAHTTTIKEAIKTAEKLKEFYLDKNKEAAIYYKGIFDALTWVIYGIDEDLFSEDELAFIPLLDWHNENN